MIELLTMRAADEVSAIRVTFSNMWSVIRKRTGVERGHEGPNFLLGEGQKKEGHATKGEGLFDLLGMRG